MVNKVRVTIAGAPYAIATTDTESYITSLAKKLDEDITKLEQQIKDLEEEICSGKLTVEDLTTKSMLLPTLKEELDEKSMRWLELSELS